MSAIAKNNIIAFRATDKEYSMIREYAEKSDMSITTFLRASVNEYIYNHFLLENDQKEEETD